MVNTAYFRFYEQLNDFLPVEQRHQTLVYRFKGQPGIKDAIEALGIPHPEVELILVNEDSVGFDYQLRGRDRVAVHGEPTDVTAVPRASLRPPRPRQCRFILDVNLGKLARLLRLCGFDAAYRNDYSDSDVAAIGAREQRVVLTRDRRLLYHRTIIHGYFVRATAPDDQLREILTHFDLALRLRPFRRCIDCNGVIGAVAKETVLDLLEPLTRLYYQEFFRCARCGKIYWKGSHYQHMQNRLRDLTAE